MSQYLTQTRLKEVVHYDPVTGIFIWRIRSSNRIKVGARAGSVCKVYGYIHIRIDGRLHRAHRLAHLYMTGRWPAKEVDQENHDRADNRWLNLRAAGRCRHAANIKHNFHPNHGEKNAISYT